MAQDVYIVAAARTAVAKANRGALTEARCDDMAAAVVREAVRRAGIEEDRVREVVMGCAFPPPDQNMNVARAAAVRAGLPYTVPAVSVNRLCASGLEAIHIAASSIRAGQGDIAVAGGVESMTLVPRHGFVTAPNAHLTEHHPGFYANMGQCGDNVAKRFGITREDADAWGLRSHEKAIAAMDAGTFSEEIVPYEIADADGAVTVFDTDEGPRRGTSLQALSRLRPAFAESVDEGVCTAGNSSQRSDGAAAVCLMNETALRDTGAAPLAKVLAYAVAAGDPDFLGPAQIRAIPKALALSGIAQDDLDLIESNEAFATQCLYVLREMRFDLDKVNVNGGAIALGHPLGCTGAKLTAQIIYELRRRGGKYGLVTMCIGEGMGAAGVFEICD